MSFRYLRFKFLDKNKPLIHLSIKKKNKNGKSFGKIVCRHKFRGYKKQIRIVDNYRSLWNIKGKVLKFDFNSNNKSFIALISYTAGFLSYVPCVYGFRLNSTIISSYFLKKRLFRSGNSTFLASMPTQKKINNVELFPMKGSQYLKSPGSFGKITKKNFFYVWVKLRSSFVIKVSSLCFASIGTVRIVRYNLPIYKKAGYIRMTKGVRPKVRGVAKNPIDHPHGGGEGKKSGKSTSMSPWGKLVKGKKTVRKYES